MHFFLVVFTLLQDVNVYHLTQLFLQIKVESKYMLWLARQPSSVRIWRTKKENTAAITDLTSEIYNKHTMAQHTCPNTSALISFFEVAWIV